MNKQITSFYLALTIVFLMICTPSFSQNKNSTNKLERPKLVVGIVVDQMRWDYLYRYYDRYNNDGFKRILNEGFSAENTYIDYVPTVTAIGHSTLYTGSVPSIHGIAGNDFIIQKTGQTVYCAEDKDVLTVGSNSKAGLMSPKNLLASTITDELKLATNFRSKVIGVSIKDRGSILPAGHLADASYWYDGSVGKWITSSWYMKELPTWVNKFNDQNLIEKYLNQGWNTLYPIETYVQSTSDNNEFEGKFKGTDAPVFPVNTAKLLKENGPGIITSTPYGNTFTIEMAKAAIKNEAMGQRGITDFLAMSLSSPDYIGHQFGPNSIEVEDNYLRLDKDLGDFLSYLDQTIGKGEYTIFLSADHGAAHNATFMQDNNMPSGGFGTGKVLTELNEHLTSIFKEE
jgi:predicted AlkP superfamily pyrophosphatase or phosphodiesterase